MTAWWKEAAKSYSVRTQRSGRNLNVLSLHATILLISAWVSGSRIELKIGSNSATPFRNISKILCGSKSVCSEVSSCSGPNVCTDSDLLQSNQVDCLDSMHQNRFPTVCRKTSTMSGPGPVAVCNLWPRNAWQQRKSLEIAEIAIHASGLV